ncbi:MAG: HAD-IA family hydrolase [Treponema sp.]|jgi:putative hydrolase of the HAD superfamily|nr:HAD-IA family hydrolase [Treponema sp.]
MIQYVLFDLDNTLYSARYGLEDNVSRRIRSFLAEFLGVSPEEAWRQRSERLREFGTTLEWITTEKGFTDIERYFAFVHPEDEADSLPPDPALRAFLERLPQPKAILTNSPGEHANRIIGRLGISGLFTHIFDIRGNNLKGKPNPGAYLRPFEIMGAAPGEVLFVDDSPSYVDGCRALGGRGVLLDEYNAWPAYPGPRIRRLGELEGIIGGSEPDSKPA